MIYKNQKSLSLVHHNDYTIRKRASRKKFHSSATDSIYTQNFTNKSSKHITSAYSKPRQESTERNYISRYIPLFLNSQILVLLLFLFITIFTSHHYFKYATSTERTRHRYSDLSNQISLTQYHSYHFLHRTRHKPPEQLTPLSTIQPTDQHTGRPSSYSTSQSIASPMEQQPTSQPTSLPSGPHTGQPTRLPPALPSGPHSGQPTRLSTSLPSGPPTGQNRKKILYS